MRKYVLVLTSLIVLTIFSGICSAEVPHLINFQGYLVDSANNPLNGDYEITFKIYNDSKGGDLVWSETNIIPVEQGLYSIVLGKQNPIKQKIEGDIWFAMQINGQPEMEPR
ncbi:MAG: hypothetical protein GY855_13100, partial [candidate division Zixibacteria bacterium]|nr:hypothetical protein [candidate division Zixibacteria bacterium]